MEVRKFSDILEGINSPRKLKEFKGAYGKTNIWVEEKPSTGEMFVSIDGDGSILVSDLPQLINILKKI